MLNLYSKDWSKKNLEESVVSYWLGNYSGESYYLNWWGNGWVIQYQESFLCKDGHFQHKEDIVSFKHSRFGDGWQHVFDTKEEAIETFKKRF